MRFLFALLGMLKMFDIPIGARHIVIEENETSPHIIGECVPHFFHVWKHLMLLTENNRAGL